MVSVDPIRMFLYRWMIETGDPIEVVAKGFDVDEGIARSVISGALRVLPATQVDWLQQRLGIASPGGSAISKRRSF